MKAKVDGIKFENKVALLIDGNYLMHRSFYSTIGWFKNKYYNAVWQFNRTLNMLITKYKTNMVLILFDAGKSFRKDLDSSYKATRTEMPRNLKTQFSILQGELVSKKIKFLSWSGLEADDLIGIVAQKIKNKVGRILIISNDKDLNQLVDDKVNVFKPVKRGWILVDEQYVKERYGINPSQFADYLALVGDTADNIKSAISKCGKKTAAKLLQKYGSIENLVKQEEYRKYKNILLHNKKLTTIVTNI